MFYERDEKEKLNAFFQKLKLKNVENESSMDKAAKIEQILAYLEMVHARVKNYSPKRNLVFIDCGAGNCYLSYLLNYYYTHINPRKLTIHCIDTNARLMEKCYQQANEFGFKNMNFHASDIADFQIGGNVDLVYSLHACDLATDKTLHLGLRHKATCILSVSCCQHSIKKHLRRHHYTGITKHRIFKERLVYMVGDSLRALLLEMHGYRTDILEFVSSRYTDKNIMLRAQKSNPRNIQEIEKEYEAIQKEFNVIPTLETYLE